MRTTRESVTFDHPFSLAAVGEVQPAGTYIVEIDEELIDGCRSSPIGGSRPRSTCRSTIEGPARSRPSGSNLASLPLLITRFNRRASGLPPGAERSATDMLPRKGRL